MADAIAAMREARKKAGAVPLTSEDRTNLNAYLADQMANNGWSAEDRKEYLEACKAEFDNPTEAGGLEAATAFWAEKARVLKVAA